MMPAPSFSAWATIEVIGNHLWQSTLFAAAAGLLTLALRNNRAQVRYWLWLAASVKFLIPFGALVTHHERAVAAALTRYDALVAGIGAETRRVLTHGEPHAGNTMFTAEGWKLIDWDTAQLAPPDLLAWLPPQMIA